MTNNDIPDNNNVARYCSPRTINEDNMPTTSAFSIRDGEEYLSVNWLEYFGKLNMSESITQLQKIFSTLDYGIKKDGRFAVLMVKDIKTVISAVSHIPQIKHIPMQDNDSHAGIYIKINEYTVAQVLARLIKNHPENVYPAIV